MRHLRQVGDDRPAADVVAKGQRHGGLVLVVLRRHQHFGEAHHLPVFVGNLDAHGGLAGDHFHHPYADHRQRARQVLGQVGNAADLHAGRRLDFVTGDHRARMDGFHLDLDAELLELDLQQARHGLQRFGRVALLLLPGRVEQGQRRQGAFHGAVDEQRGLLLLLHAPARLHRLGRRGRIDLRRRAALALLHALDQGFLALDQALLDLRLLPHIGNHRRDHLGDPHVHLAQLRGQLLALAARAPPAIGGVLDQFEEVEGDLPGQVHDLEPGHVGEHGETEEEQRQEQQRAALHVQGVDPGLAEALAHGAARRSRHVRAAGVEMDIGQRGAGQDQEHQADQAPGEQPAAPLPGHVALAEHLPGLDRQQQREDVGEIAEGHEQDVGEHRPQATGGVLHLHHVAGVAPARVGRVVGEQRHPQIEAQCAQRDQGPFLQAIMQLLPPCGCVACCGRVLQNASFPAHGARPRVCERPIVRL
ncbi:hypothetical protein D9M71_248860 [compost metagenome]